MSYEKQDFEISQLNNSQCLSWMEEISDEDFDLCVLQELLEEMLMVGEQK